MLNIIIQKQLNNMKSAIEIIQNGDIESKGNLELSSLGEIIEEIEKWDIEDHTTIYNRATGYYGCTCRPFEDTEDCQHIIAIKLAWRLGILNQEIDPIEATWDQIVDEHGIETFEYLDQLHQEAVDLGYMRHWVDGNKANMVNDQS